MRTSDLQHLASLEHDEIAGDAFDRQTPGVQNWIAEAVVGEWTDDARRAALWVIDRAVDLYHRPQDAERVARLRYAVASLREDYIEHAARHGTYEREALDAVNCRAADQAEEAREAAVRG